MDENWLIYVNGEMVQMKDAKISVFDRAFQYGDDLVFRVGICDRGRVEIRCAQL